MSAWAGTRRHTPLPSQAALTREMASDYGRLGLRVNAISPGEIEYVAASAFFLCCLPSVLVFSLTRHLATALFECRLFV